MAELQYVVNVKCINAKLAEIMTGELGDLIIVNIPNNLFSPHEFDKLIEATKIIREQASENRKKENKEIEPLDKGNQKKHNIGVIEKRKLWEINILQSGEIILIDIPSRALAPSEFDDFIEALEQTKNLAARLYSKKHTEHIN